MTYATINMVKDRLGIAIDDTRRDDDITRGLTWADAQIDNGFDEIKESVPSPLPQILVEAAADFAAYYVMRNKNAASAKLYLEKAQYDLDRYLSKRYRETGLM